MSTDTTTTTLAPQKDFYQYINHDWIEKTKLPAQESRWTAYSEVEEKMNKELKIDFQEALDKKKKQSPN